MRRIIQYAIVTVWTGAAFLAGVAAKPLLARAVRGDPADHPSHLMRLDQFRALQASTPTVVMLGDSLIENGEWAEWLGPGVINRGIGQNTTRDVLVRLDAVPRSPVAVLMIGSNDIEAGAEPDEVSSRTATIIERLARKVLLVSVLPRSGQRNDQTERLNALNEELCEKGHCTYVDLYPPLAPSGELDPSLTRDGVHLNGEGYRRWAIALTRSASRTLPP